MKRCAVATARSAASTSAKVGTPAECNSLTVSVCSAIEWITIGIARSAAREPMARATCDSAAWCSGMSRP